MGQQLQLIELPPMPPAPMPPPAPAVVGSAEVPATKSPEIGIWWHAVLVVVREGRRLRLRWRDERLWLGSDARGLNVWGPRGPRELGAVFVAEVLTLVAPRDQTIERYFRAYRVRRVIGDTPPVEEGPDI